MHHIMLDIETLGTAPGSIIASIAAVVFGPEGTGPTFYRRICLDSCAAAGLSPDMATLNWWLRQDSAARSELTHPDRRHLCEALLDLTAFIKSMRPTEPEIWGNGSDFDNTLLAAAYTATGLTCPWKYWKNRCYRTLKSLFPHIPYTPPQIPHHALHDATAQAQHAGQILAWLESTRTPTAAP